MNSLVHIAAGFLFAGYATLCALPAELLWFDPAAPDFADAIEGEAPPELTYSRHIHRDAAIHYAAVVREAGTNEIACEGDNGPFPYLRNDGPVVGKNLTWWIPDDPRCASLPAGVYWPITTWTVVEPLGALLPEPLASLIGWIVPPKRVTREGPPFIIQERLSRSSHD